jgi:hypothetical protein
MLTLFSPFSFLSQAESQEVREVQESEFFAEATALVSQATAATTISTSS